MFRYDNSIFVRQWFDQSNFRELVSEDDIVEVCQTDFSYDEIEERIKDFCEEIKNIYEPSNVIVNEFYLARFWKDSSKVHEFKGEFLKLVEKSERHFNEWYQLLIENLPGCKVVKFSRDYYAHKNNPRGLSPCHLEKAYYEDTYSQIVEIIKKDYGEKRKIPLSDYKISIKKGLYEKYNNIKHSGGDYINRVFSRIESCTTLKNKRMLWISNRFVPENLTRRVELDKFAQLFIPRSEIELKQIKERYINIQNLDDKTHLEPNNIFAIRNFAYYIGNIEDMSNGFLDCFDIIFVDDMEYLKKVGVCLDNIYKSLKKDGVFLGKTGRTWLSSTGSKWEGYIKNEKNFPQHVHLLYTLQEIVDYIVKKYKVSYSNAYEKAIEVCSGDEGLNHLFYEDYKLLVANSLFSFKSINPLFPIILEEETRIKLENRYPGYKMFDFNSLWIYCEK